MFIIMFSLAGPGFAIFSVIQLLLPVMSLWLQRSHGDHSYWDVAAANFKHAIGLSCELVVEHVNSFIHSGEKRLCVFTLTHLHPQTRIRTGGSVSASGLKDAAL